MKSLRRDLFERRLWPVILLLLAAIVAVVFVLSGQADPTTAVVVPPVPAAAPALTDAGDDAGLPASVPVSERLFHSKAMRDPFAAGVTELTATPPSQLANSASSATTGETATTTTAAGLSAQSSVVASTSTASTAASPGNDAAAAATVTVTTPHTTTVTRTVTRTVTATTASAAAATTPSSWTIYRVDVSIGAAGQTATRADLMRLTPLPTPAAPEAMFDGVTAGGRDAVFALADGVHVQGPGLCRPSPTHCVGVVLPIGGVETLAYTGAAGAPETLTLTVTHIFARVTRFQAEAMAAARRESTAGACELDLADPIAWNSRTMATTAHIPGVCLLDKSLVPFPGIGGS